MSCSGRHFTLLAAVKCPEVTLCSLLHVKILEHNCNLFEIVLTTEYLVFYSCEFGLWFFKIVLSISVQYSCAFGSCFHETVLKCFCKIQLCVWFIFSLTLCLIFLYSILSPFVVDCCLISSVHFVSFPSLSLCCDTRGL